MRVYVGATATDLKTLHVERMLRAPRRASAVTPALREWYAEGVAEELEYVALTLAADDALGLLHERPDEPRRRTVVACDVPDDTVRADPAAGRAVVTLTADVPIDHVAAIHIDDDEAAEVVRRAADECGRAATGDADAAFAVDETHDHELLWHATQELAALVNI
ncbi:MAG: hypothetical protein ABR520_03060 [Mycobacteriales bacterium]|nr:hypothetical protein [Frankia sp.]